MPKYVPKDMEWFLAEMIQEFKIGDNEKSLIWVNTILIKASSMEEAYSKSMQQGELYNDTYKNSDGEIVVTTFRGLRNLLLIYEPLEDGAEIIWEEYEDQSEEEIADLIKQKNQLEVFLTHGPDTEESNDGEVQDD